MSNRALWNLSDGWYIAEYNDKEVKLRQARYVLMGQKVKAIKEKTIKLPKLVLALMRLERLAAVYKLRIAIKDLLAIQ